MFEVEIKARVGNIATTARRMISLGAKPIREEVQVDTYFDTPDGKLRRRREAMRVRRLPPAKSGVLTLKGARLGKDVKQRKEVEAPVDDAVTLISILKMSGLGVVGRVRKRSRVFEYRNTRVRLDHVDKLGDFLEVEIMVKEKCNLHAHRAKLLSVTRELVGRGAVVEPRTYLEMILEQKRAC